MTHISKTIGNRLPKTYVSKSEKTISEYIRKISLSNHELGQNDVGDFKKLFSDVAIMREMMSAHSMSAEKILALAQCLTKIASFANPPAYSHHVDEIKGLHRELFSKLKAPLS